MNTQTLELSHEPRQPELFPADLSRWIAGRDLIHLILNTVQAIDESRITVAAPTDEARLLPPRLMLTLLTYCYATGVYRSGDIEARSRQDDTVRYLCAHQRPAAEFIRRFRNRNRELLVQCLTVVCHTVARHRPAFQGARPLLHFVAHCEARERLAFAEIADLPRWETETAT